MKKNLTLFALIAVSIAFAIYIFKYPRVKHPTKIPTKTPMVNENDLCMDFASSPKSKLTNGLVHDMVNLYRENQLQNIQSTATGKQIDEDAYSIWFDLDTIKKFIYHFEKEMKQTDDFAKSKKGIRIYYAAYPEMDSIKKLSRAEYRDIAYLLSDPSKVNYPKKHTIIMLPTLQNEKGIIYDINLFDSKTFKNGIEKKEFYNGASSMSALQRTTAISAVSSGRSSSDMAARNHGNLAPPETKAGHGF